MTPAMTLGQATSSLLLLYKKAYKSCESHTFYDTIYQELHSTWYGWRPVDHFIRELFIWKIIILLYGRVRGVITPRAKIRTTGRSLFREKPSSTP